MNVSPLVEQEKEQKLVFRKNKIDGTSKTCTCGDVADEGYLMRSLFIANPVPYCNQTYSI
jgi:hypothetical protein